MEIARLLRIINILYDNSLDIQTIMGRINELFAYLPRVPGS